MIRLFTVLYLLVCLLAGWIIYLVWPTVFPPENTQVNTPVKQESPKKKEAKKHKTVVLHEDTLLYADSMLGHSIGRLQKGSRVSLCAERKHSLGLCTYSALPSLFIKSDSPMGKAKAQRWPSIRTIAASKDHIYIGFNGSYIPAHYVRDSAESDKIEIVFLYTKYDLRHIQSHVEKPYEVYASTLGGKGVLVQLAGDIGCGVRLKRLNHRFLKIERKSCKSKKPFKIVLDPGHGGDDLGACRDNLCEKDLALQVSQALLKKLQSAGYTVTTTRSTDKRVELQERLIQGINEQPDLFLSLHFDHWSESKSPSVSPHGTSCYYFHNFLSTPAKTFCNNKPIVGDLPSEYLFKRSLYVVTSHEYPSVLVELANLAEDEDYTYLTKSFDPDKIAESLLSRVKTYVQGLNLSASN